MISVIIPAHNESSVIGRALSAMTDGFRADEIDIVVVCNGCTDDTADAARCFGSVVRVIELNVASKTHALNIGDRNARSFPRVYADADIIITTDAIRALARRLESNDVFAVAPTPDIEATGCSWPVRAYYRIRSLLPSRLEGIGGSGVYALSEDGRRRFVDFPNVIADDAYIRVQFKQEERETLSSARSTVFAPRRIRQLIAIRTRAYYGTLEVAHRFPHLWVNKGEGNHRAIVRLLKDPRLWLGVFIYAYVNIIARCYASFQMKVGNFTWHRDDTSRGGPPVSSAAS